MICESKGNKEGTYAFFVKRLTQRKVVNDKDCQQCLVSSMDTHALFSVTVGFVWTAAVEVMWFVHHVQTAENSAFMHYCQRRQFSSPQQRPSFLSGLHSHLRSAVLPFPHQPNPRIQ